MDMPCLNCRKEVAPNDAKIFAGVFVCPTCNTMAEHFYAQAQHKVTALLVGLKERMREALVEGRFEFAEGLEGEPSKKEVLEAILKLMEATDARNVATGNDALSLSDP